MQWISDSKSCGCRPAVKRSWQMIASPGASEPTLSYNISGAYDGHGHTACVEVRCPRLQVHCAGSELALNAALLYATTLPCISPTCARRQLHTASDAAAALLEGCQVPSKHQRPRPRVLQLQQPPRLAPEGHAPQADHFRADAQRVLPPRRQVRRGAEASPGAPVPAEPSVEQARAVFQGCGSRRNAQTGFTQVACLPFSAAALQRCTV